MSDAPLSEAWKSLARTVPNYVRRASWEALASATAQQGGNVHHELVMEIYRVQL